MSTAPARNSNPAQAVLFGGLALMAAAVVWWLVYYAQWRGMFGLLQVKLSCVSGDSPECSNFQDFIGASPIPVYSPWLLWLGVIVVVLGLYLMRRNRV